MKREKKPAGEIFKETSEYDVVKSLVKERRKPEILKYVSEETLRAAEDGLIVNLKRTALEIPPYEAFRIIKESEKK